MVLCRQLPQLIEIKVLSVGFSCGDTNTSTVHSITNVVFPVVSVCEQNLFTCLSFANMYCNPERVVVYALYSNLYKSFGDLVEIYTTRSYIFTCN